MNLNYEIIRKELKDPPTHVIDSTGHTLPFSGIRWLERAENNDDDSILYFGEWASLKEIGSGYPHHLICAGGGEEAAALFPGNGINGLVFPDTDATRLFNSIQDLFFKYERLDRRLMEAVIQARPTQEILNICSEFFHGHTELYDSNLNLIEHSSTYTPDETDLEWRETVRDSKISFSLFSRIRQLYSISNPQTSSDAIFLELSPEFSNRLSCSLYYNSRRIGTLAVSETEEPLHEYQTVVLDYLSQLLSATFATRYATREDSMSIMRSAFVNLLRGIENEQPKVLQSLKLAGWNRDDNYCLLTISSPDTRHDLGKAFRRVYEYENTFPDCVAFRYLDNIVLVIHNDTPETMAEGTVKLEKLLVKHDTVCGVGIPFNSIDRINEQYINAQLAIQVGEESKRIRYLQSNIPELFSYLFSDTTSIISLCHRSAVRLMEYDAKNGTEYLRTLRAYLKHNRSIKDAADELFIHRNTMSYRLNCMKSIANLDYNDPTERILLLVSSIVLDSTHQAE